MKNIPGIAAACVLALVALCTHSLARAASVEMFSPQGEIKGVRQVTARFTQAMVPFGDPRLVEPFDIECPETGTGRWADPKNWVFDFERDLPAGVRCQFTLKADVRTDAGETVDAASFQFSTGGPAILTQMPEDGSQIDEEQAFVLGLDAHASAESVLAHTWCDVKGIREKIGVRILEGKERDAILAGRPDFMEEYRGALMSGSQLERMLKGKGDLPVLVLQCKRRFPNEATVRLVWGKGVVSASGIETSQDQALNYSVRPDFRATFSCQRANAKAGCLPISTLRLNFSSPVSRKLAQQISLKDASGRAYKGVLPEAREAPDFVDGIEYAPPFPEQMQFKIELPAALRDDAGRKLANAGNFPLGVKTDSAPPLAKFPATFGIIESAIGGELPVTLRSIESPALAKALRLSAEDAKAIPARQLKVATGNAAQIIGWLRRVDRTTQDQWVRDAKSERDVRIPAGSQSVFTVADRTSGLSLPRAGGERAFEVIGIPLREPGLHIVEIASPKLGAALLVEPPKEGDKPKPRPAAAPVYYAPSVALVTNLAVHFKHGRESSLVWVTRLDTGKPVAKAAVSVQDCGGREFWKGSTDASGIARIRRELPQRNTLVPCLSDYDPQYVVIARSAQDMSFVLSEWNEGIARWRFNLPSGDWSGPVVANTVFDRTLVRVGDTVHMKHFYRKRVGQGFQTLKSDVLPRRLKIRHRGSDQEYEVAVQWDGRSTAENQWKVPDGARTGTYEVQFEDTLGDSRESMTRTAGEFRVEEFRVPTMRAAVVAPAQPMVDAEKVPLDVQVSYLSGGGAGNQNVKLRGVVQPRLVSFPDYEGFIWAAAPVKEGIEKPVAWSWRSGEYEMEGEEGDLGEGAGARDDPQRRALRQVNLTLDGAGAARAELSGVPRSESVQELLAELEYADANGEILTAATRVPLWPSAMVLGIKPDSWALSKEKLRFQVVALAIDGKPAAGVALQVDLFQRISYSHRKRLVGGFYGYERGEEIKRLGVVCEGRSNDKGYLFCEATSPVGGEVILQARAQDAAGRISHTQTSAWIADKADWWFDASNDDRMDVVPERKRYEPGEKAVLQVRMPFRQATALVTIEREGVLDAFVRTLSGKSPVVSVPLAGHYAPNAFVSVLAVRGRVAGVAPTALVDLGKPSFKMGVAELQVGWKAHELKVGVRTDRQVYKVREKVKVDVQVSRALDGKPVKGGEVVLAAVDEGLLELAPNASWKLLDAMMARRGIEVDTATAAMQVVGKRHYGRKALPPGGGGGRQSSRELFDTLLSWKARVKLDDQGRASVEVPLQDSLTAFRIVAVAHAGAGLFGTGGTTVRSTQDLQILSGLTPLVREQDRYQARFTVRNASDRALQAQVSARWSARGEKEAAAALETRTVELAAGEARDVSWDVRAPVSAEQMRWEVSAVAQEQSDRIKVTQKVIPAVAVRTFQATLAQLDRTAKFPTQMPGDAIAGRGGVRVTLQRTLASELAGVREYMERYPYSCLEQQVSQAVALRDEQRWRRITAELSSYLDADGLAKYFHTSRTGSEVLTAYVLQIAHEAGWALGNYPRNRMEEALVAFVEGRIQRPTEMPTADLSLRKLAALDALARGGREIRPEWLQSIAVEANLWPTSGVLDWHSFLRRAKDLPEREARMAQAEQILRARLNFQGTTMGFSTERNDYLWWLMAHGDVNANRLLLSVVDQLQWKEDVPRLVRGTLGRQQGGHWSTTVANAWGVLALEKFSAAFERDDVTGSTVAQLGAQEKTLAWKEGAPGGALMFAWPKQKDTLELEHQGEGQPWVTLQSLAAVPLKAPFSSGFRIQRSVSAIERKDERRWSRGDVMRVRLDLESQADMTWVVVRDPIPAGAALLGTGLGRDSQILAAGEKKAGWVWPAFEERTQESFRAYYRFVPKGKWALEYTLRLNNPGDFQMPETRVEAMYAPEMFAESPNTEISVAP